MNEKQQQLTFNKGITNVPSDALCSDNSLQESLGMVYDDGEHRVIQKPVESSNTSIPNGYKLLYIHKIGTTRNAISTNGSSLYYNSSAISGAIANNNTTVTSIGKTLIVNTGSVMSYFLWKGNEYSQLSFPLPDLDFRARIHAVPLGGFAYSSASCNEILTWVEGSNNTGSWKVADDKSEDYNNLVTGLYAKNKKAIANDKCFCEPFFVRAALELYDGSYTFITNPILLFPNVNKSSYGFVINQGKTFVLATNAARLELYQNTNYSAYADIVKDVVVFASKGAMIYNTEGDQKIETPAWSDIVVANCVGVTTGNTNNYFNIHVQNNPTLSIFGSPIISDQSVLFCLKPRTDNDIKGDLEGTSVFYKIASLGINGTDGNWIDAASKMADYVLPNLTTQEQLPYDDYFSRSELRADGMYAYNGRLNLYGVERKLFRGFTYFMPLDHSQSKPYFWYVKITTEQGPKWVYFAGNSSQKQGFYFFYPDARATEVLIIKKDDNTVVCHKWLTAHSGLNGAFFLRQLPNNNTFQPSDTGDEPQNVPSDVYEFLPNYLLTSEVNNPWVFKASGYNCIGNGKILGLSTTTTALSEGQFGQYPLLVFSEDGIWALSLDGTGMYTSIRPMSREVCNNPKSITQTDGAVFFASKKGLMMIVGSQVKCVSEQLSGNGNAFRQLLRDAVIAYDYRDSLLWLFTTAGNGNRFCHIYSIKSGTFATYNCETAIVNVVNDYPDYLLQQGNTILTLLGRPDINADNTTYNVRLTSRPAKLENALALKSVMQVRHINCFSSDTWIDENENPPKTKKKLQFHLFASNDLKNWYELKSLTGTPWKYYRFQYIFNQLLATDRFAGTMLITQERRTNKLR